MSTGMDCHIYEKEPDVWFYELEYADEQYQTYGPFDSFEIADKHLSDNHPNPGGFSVEHYGQG